MALVQSAWAGPALNTNLDAYFIFALRNADLKNIQVLGACNSGVNCPHPNNNDECGRIVHENPFYADGSQIVGDEARFTKPGGDIFQLFRNGGPALAGVVNIRMPGANPDGSDPWTPPIIGDLDGDQIPSCQLNNNQCQIDFGDLEAACGFPPVFPTCDLTKPVLVLANADCAPPIIDAQPANGRCDLSPGSYGNLTVQNSGKLTFVGGNYNFCSVNFGKGTNTIADAPATLNVVGDFGINNDASFGQNCGDITVNLKGPGGFTFGRNSTIKGDFCAPQRTMFIGHNNDLTGHFWGDTINADSNVRGFCCDVANPGSCTCIDDFSPATASVGGLVKLTGACDLTLATAVKICGINATIQTQTAAQLDVLVPVGAAGACSVVVESATGKFTHVGTLTVN